ncbi:DrmB family protein [Gordonia sp. NPDC003504]
MALTKKVRKRPPTKASVRRAQMITTYGVGSVLPVESESFMIAGLDHWSDDSRLEIEEHRLCNMLGVRRLLAPPGGEVAGMVPMVRFPEWVSCPKCNRLDRFGRLADKPKGEYVNRCRYCLTPKLVPSRFVACCPAGHIQDFPYRYWAHKGAGVADDGDHPLKVITNPADSSLAGIRIQCGCGESRTLKGALGSGSLSLRCGGNLPWLDDEKDECAENLVGLQRGASNVWFADVRSALTVDRSLTKAEEVLERILPDLDGMQDNDIATYLGIKARQHGVKEAELLAAFRANTIEPKDYAEANRELRATEYEALGRLHPEGDGTSTFVCFPTEVSPSERAGNLIDLVSRVTRLREVRALNGFARVSASPVTTGTASGALSRRRVGWLPAIEVLGEGVFIRLREDVVSKWESSSLAQWRASMLMDAAQSAAPSSAGSLPPISPRFMAVHSLSHILLREMAIDTGYPASSIRERVYAETGQAGVLLYTATADAAGSLGGLCSHGTVANITKILDAATESAQWCSADPVCLESIATGAGATNLAACHSCLLAPEVSCEFQNRYLDRACLVGTDGESESESESGLLW